MSAMRQVAYRQYRIGIATFSELYVWIECWISYAVIIILIAIVIRIVNKGICIATCVVDFVANIVVVNVKLLLCIVVVTNVQMVAARFTTN